MINDFRFAFRMLWKNPAFTLVAVATLALGIGANTAVLSLINALLLRPLPYKNPQQLVLIWEQFSRQGLDRIPVSAPEYLDYEKELRSYDGIAAFDYVSLNLTGGDMPERIQGSVVTPSLFPLLGIEPIKGRTFAPNESQTGENNVVVISERLWHRRFNSDPQIVGSTLSLNGRTYSVVGIMPASFEFPLPLFNVQGGTFGERADIWVPIAFTEQELKSRGSRSYGVIGRLRQGVGAGQAQAELQAVTARWIHRIPENYPQDTGFGARVYGLHDQVVGGMRPALLILLASVALVLLIACANLTTMLLARAGAREREMAIRIAVGAGPLRVLRQLLSESVLLSVFGGIAGVILAIWGLQLLTTIGGRTVPRLREVNVDTTVLIVTFVISVATGIFFGVAPAMASAKPELTEALKEGGRGATSGLRRNRLRNSLVIAEVSLALVLLVSAGLLMKSFVRLQHVNAGFDSHNVLTMEISLPISKYPRGKPVGDYYVEALRHVKALPGVEHAAFTNILPLSGNNSDSSFIIEGRDPKASGVYPDEELRDITPEYFQVLKTPLLKGRFFTEADTAEASPVIIINQAFAKKYWPNEDPIGKRLSHDGRNPKWISVVGVVGDIHHRGLEVDAAPEQYLPHSQAPTREMILAVRSAQDPRALAASIRKELQTVDPELPLANVRTFDEVVSDSVAPRRLSVTLLGLFAGIALVLASVGIYGVMSFLVVQRTHEIGVRMALGAQHSDVLRIVVGHGMKLVVIGTAIGLLLAIFSARALGAMLYHVGAFDFTTFAAVTLALGAVALLASYIPAARLVRADPMLALAHTA
jgi:putative ABC transport system permease protein